MAAPRGVAMPATSAASSGIPAGPMPGGPHVDAADDDVVWGWRKNIKERWPGVPEESLADEVENVTILRWNAVHGWMPKGSLQSGGLTRTLAIWWSRRRDTWLASFNMACVPCFDVPIA